MDEPRGPSNLSRRNARSAASSKLASGGAAARPRLRCAIYTRKSSDEGLEQSFNSLHAQRDACEAFIASQRHEGWTLVPTAYDDGGLSGGTMQRPALERLLNDVRSGLVDIVVVYKVDRLTRSLADFAKLTELFDRHDASFVSVTQAFNTSTSMGRLTLNVLLSFAQFEREVAGERIRDKIALSKRRGMWMGGLPPLGYDGIERQLVVNEAEAEMVRGIFRLYLACASVAELQQKLDAAGIVSKRRCFGDGRTSGGVAMGRGALYQILQNRLYRGEIAHHGEVHAGVHQPIVDAELWAEVQAKLAAGGARPRGRGPRKLAPALLAGIAFDQSGERLAPSFATKRGRQYRYYVSAPLTRGGRSRDDPGKGLRVPMADLDRLAVGAMRDHLADPVWIIERFGSGTGTGVDAGTAQRLIAAAGKLAVRIGEIDPDAVGEDGNGNEMVRRLLQRVEVARGRLRIELDPVALCEGFTGFDEQLSGFAYAADETVAIEVAAAVLRCGREVRLVVGEVSSERPGKPDPMLVELVRSGRRWFEALRTGQADSIAAIANQERQQVSYVSRNLSLAFLAPDIVELILSGQQPATLTPERLKAARPLPTDWTEQRAMLLG